MNPRKYLLLIATLFIATTSTSMLIGQNYYLPLHDAVRSGNIKKVRAWLDVGCDLTETDIDGRTPYQFAKELGRDDIAELIKYPLHYAVKRGGGWQVVFYLQQGKDPNERNNDGKTALELAQELGRDDIAIFLGNINYGSRKYFIISLTVRTIAPPIAPIQIAIESANSSRVESLLSSGIDPNLHDFSGLTPLHYAVALNRIEIVKLLLQYDANPDAKSKDSFFDINSAMQYEITVSTSPKELAKKLAIKMRNPQILKILLDDIEEKRIAYSVERFLNNQGNPIIDDAHTTETELDKEGLLSTSLIQFINEAEAFLVPCPWEPVEFLTTYRGNEERDLYFVGNRQVFLPPVQTYGVNPNPIKQTSEHHD